MFFVRLTHLRFDGAKWYLRFSGNDFTLMLDKLKTYSRLDARWSPAYEWPDGRRGAWYVSERILALISDHLVNLSAMKQLDEMSRIPVQVRTSLVALEMVAVPTSTDELKLAYRRMAKRYHPDLHGGSHFHTEKMKVINNAHETLVAWLETVSKCA